MADSIIDIRRQNRIDPSSQSHEDYKRRPVPRKALTVRKGHPVDGVEKTEIRLVSYDYVEGRDPKQAPTDTVHDSMNYIQTKLHEAQRTLENRPDIPDIERRDFSRFITEVARSCYQKEGASDGSVCEGIQQIEQTQTHHQNRARSRDPRSKEDVIEAKGPSKPIEYPLLPSERSRHPKRTNEGRDQFEGNALPKEQMQMSQPKPLDNSVDACVRRNQSQNDVYIEEKRRRRTKNEDTNQCHCCSNCPRFLQRPEYDNKIQYSATREKPQRRFLRSPRQETGILVVSPREKAQSRRYPTHEANPHRVFIRAVEQEKDRNDRNEPNKEGARRCLAHNWKNKREKSNGKSEGRRHSPLQSAEMHRLQEAVRQAVIGLTVQEKIEAATTRVDKEAMRPQKVKIIQANPVPTEKTEIKYCHCIKCSGKPEIKTVEGRAEVNPDDSRCPTSLAENIDRFHQLVRQIHLIDKRRNHTTEARFAHIRSEADTVRREIERQIFRNRKVPSHVSSQIERITVLSKIIDSGDLTLL